MGWLRHTDQAESLFRKKEGGLKSSIHGGKWEYTDKEDHFYDR